MSEKRETHVGPLVFSNVCIRGLVPSEGPSFPLGVPLADLFLSAAGGSHYKDGDETLPQKFVSAVIVGPAGWRLNHRMDLMWRFSQHTLTNSLTRYPE